MGYTPPAEPFQENTNPIGGGRGQPLDAAFFTALVAGVDDADTRLTTVEGRFAGSLNVKDYGATGNGATDDRAAIQSAVTAAIAAGRRTVYFPPGTYTISGSINCGGATGLVLVGAVRNLSRLVPSGAVSSAFTANTSCSDVTFQDLGFVGSAVDDVTVPRRARTYGANSFSRAISLLGDLEPGNTPTITNVRIRDCYFYGTSNLPVFLAGIRGEATITGCRFDNNLDVGFTHCEAATFNDNVVTRSADNGVSLSRLNQKAVCVGNSFDNCCYWAIWVAGFNAEPGPTNFVVSGNVGRNLGYGGVCADNGPQNGSITGNEFSGILRGPTDQESDVYGVGVYIGGFPSLAPDAPTTPAENITVTGNTIIDAPRGGVLVRGAKGVGVFANTIIRPGAPFLADDTTAVTTGMPTQNFGIAVDANYSASVNGLAIIGNYILDNRDIPYTNSPVYWGSAANVAAFGNASLGSRLQLVEAAQTFNSGVKTFAALIQAAGGIRVGTSNASGSVTHRVTGGPGSSRELRLDTNDVTRWMLRANATAETGATAGSDLELRAYDDAGTFLVNALSVRRSDGRVAFGAPAAAKNSTTASRPTATAAGAGANYFDTTLNKPVWSDGSNWRDAAGTVV